MPKNLRSPQPVPPGAPAYYLARPASVWLTAFNRRPATRAVGQPRKENQ